MRILKSSTTLPSIESLNSCHEFPGPFLFKIIGKNDPVFTQKVFEVFKAYNPEFNPTSQVTTLLSKKGSYQSLSVSVHAVNAFAVVKLYAQLYNLENLLGLM